MGDFLKKAQTGQPLDIPAGAYNAFVDAARDYQSRRGNRAGGPIAGDLGGVEVLVENTSGHDLEAFDILGIGDAIDGAWPTPDDNLAAFCEAPVLKGELPAAGHAGRFVVVLVPLAKDAIGPAAVAGVVPVYVNVQDADDWWADVEAGEHTTLLSGISGTAQLLYKSDSGTGPMWCLARLGHCRSLPDGDADYQVPVWDNTLKGYYPGPCRAM